MQATTALEATTGKPRREDAYCTGQLTDAVVHKLKQMACIDFKYWSCLHDPPISGLTLLQLDCTTRPTVKPEHDVSMHFSTTEI